MSRKHPSKAVDLKFCVILIDAYFTKLAREWNPHTKIADRMLTKKFSTFDKKVTRFST